MTRTYTPEDLALFARLEASTEGSRELDQEIAGAIGARNKKHPLGLLVALHYTTSVDAALTLWPEGYIELRRYSDGWYAKASGHSKEIDRVGNGTQKPAALALCIAALKARLP
jgi:hypothetical protein